MNFFVLKIGGTKKAALVVLLFSIIYQSGTVQAARNPDDFFFRLSRAIMIIIPALYLFLYLPKFSKQMKIELIAVILAFEGLAVVNFVLFPPSAVTLQYKILLFALFFNLPLFFENRNVDIENTLYGVLLVIAVVILAFYVVVELIHIPLPYTIFKREGSFTYKNYFYIYYVYSKKRFPRLNGMFWEPGVYQIYVNMALFLYYKLKKNNKIHLLVLLLNILFAQSTTGYMLAALIIAAIVIDQKKGSMSTKKLIGLVIGIVAVAGMLIIFAQKKDASNRAGDSYYDRMAQARLGMQLFLENPIFGCGFYNTQQYGILDTTRAGNSNGLFTWLYTTGIVGFLVVAIPFVFNICDASMKRKRWEKLLWLVFVVIVNMTEPIYSLSIMVYILALEYYEMINRNALPDWRRLIVKT